MKVLDHLLENVRSRVVFGQGVASGMFKTKDSDFGPACSIVFSRSRIFDAHRRIPTTPKRS